MNKAKDSFVRALAWFWSKVGHLFGDTTYLKVRFRLLMGKKLDLKNPRTFSEKLQWLKLYDRRPEYTKMVDKYAVKEYVTGIIGEEYVIPTLGVWDRPEDIEWDKLPNQFVLKTTHGGGSLGVVICKDKTTFNREDAIKRLKKNMKGSDWRIQMEWPYKNVPRRIIAEKYIEPAPDMNDLTDYKFFCFGGEPKYCQVIQDRSAIETIDFYDIDWHHQDFIGLIGLNTVANHSSIEQPKPINLNEQVKVARQLSKGIPFSRIDLYSCQGKVYFGEITLYPMGGFGSFNPPIWNKILGDYLIIR